MRRMAGTERNRRQAKSKRQVRRRTLQRKAMRILFFVGLAFAEVDGFQEFIDLGLM